VDIEDVIWTGPLPMLKDKIANVGIEECAAFSKFAEYIEEAKARIGYSFSSTLSPNNKIFLHTILDIPFEKLTETASMDLIKAVVKLRSVKGKKRSKKLKAD